MQETKRFFLILAVVVGLAVANPGTSVSKTRVAGVIAQNQLIFDLPVVPETRPTLLPVLYGAGKIPELSAKAVLVRDRSSDQTIYEKNPSETLPIASLTKLMTALVVIDSLPLDAVVEVMPEDVDTVDFRAGLVPGEKITVESLLNAMLIASANDATLALARAGGQARPQRLSASDGGRGNVDDFVMRMNVKAKLLGMRRTSFANPVGFDDVAHFSTAEDLAKLVEEFLQHSELAGIVRKKSEVVVSTDGARRHRLATTNKLLLKSDEIIGLKTGYTDESRGSLIILVSRKDESQETERLIQYYSIVLGSTSREMETGLVLDWVKENYTWK